MKTGYAVGDVMTKKPVKLPATASLPECARVMKEHDISTVIVGRGNNVEGILTEEDIVRKALAKGLDLAKATVGDIMEKDLITTPPETDIFEALMVMRNNDIRHLPVMHNNEITGLVTLKDILKVEPALFDLLLEKIKLREEQEKPIAAVFKEGEIHP